MFGKLIKRRWIEEVGYEVESCTMAITNLVVRLIPGTLCTLMIKDSIGNLISIESYNSDDGDGLSFNLPPGGKKRIFLTCREAFSSSKGNYPNQGRHLVRKPNIIDCDWVYPSIDNKTVWQLRGENCIEPQFILGRSKYPSIAKNQPILLGFLILREALWNIFS